MNTVHLFIIILLSQLSIYFYLKNNIKNLRLFNFKDYNSPLPNEVIKKTKLQSKESLSSNKLIKSMEENEHILLNKSLRHLEYISEFEMYLDDKNHENFPVEFLQEFEKIKIEAQLIVLKSTSQLTNSAKLAA